MRFDLMSRDTILGGEPTYYAEEGSILFRGPGGRVGGAAMLKGEQCSSIVFDTLEIWIELSTGRLLFAEGYCPHTAWQFCSLKPPVASRRCLRVYDVALEPGIAFPVPGPQRWLCHYDADARWLRVSSVPDPKADKLVEFATNTVAGLQGNQLTTLWVHLRWEP